MLKLIPAAAALAIFGLPAAAHTGPTPGEQAGIHVGDTATNGSAIVVTDRNGTHPEGFSGQLPVNPISASNDVQRHHHHRHHQVASAAPN